MNQDSLDYQPSPPEIGVYECQLNLKFRLIEEKSALSDSDELLEKLLEALTCGTDDYLEPIQMDVHVTDVPDMQASAKMRRQLMRLRNLTRD
jgi:hypothetical protein